MLSGRVMAGGGGGPGVSQCAGAPLHCRAPSHLLTARINRKSRGHLPSLPHQGNASAKIFAHDGGSNVICVVLTEQNLNFKANQLRLLS